MISDPVKADTHQAEPAHDEEDQAPLLGQASKVQSACSFEGCQHESINKCTFSIYFLKGCGKTFCLKHKGTAAYENKKYGDGIMCQDCAVLVTERHEKYGWCIWVPFAVVFVIILLVIGKVVVSSS